MVATGNIWAQAHLLCLQARTRRSSAEDEVTLFAILCGASLRVAKAVLCGCTILEASTALRSQAPGGTIIHGLRLSSAVTRPLVAAVHIAKHALEANRTLALIDKELAASAQGAD
eukprot:CAMPEP_0178413886 /NCGR_PEP_ID=MMETSP0689_2-20121128/22756_1 /TAXON_ID=160604 /ORGANISM="Amphidinium massartii, Strain CS-259" /LENGTH=114 /DNA_ID=CAMNT_0020035167 /DNA_START=250 /DNA_END=594 /DNA_ORIENTATION=+